MSNRDLVDALPYSIRKLMQKADDYLSASKVEARGWMSGTDAAARSHDIAKREFRRALETVTPRDMQAAMSILSSFVKREDRSDEGGGMNDIVAVAMGASNGLLTEHHAKAVVAAIVEALAEQSPTPAAPAAAVPAPATEEEKGEGPWQSKAYDKFDLVHYDDRAYGVIVPKGTGPETANVWNRSMRK